MEGKEILSASFGDETSMQDITKTIRDMIDGTSLDVPVDNQLVPIFSGTPRVALTAPEQSQIRDNAIQQCGAADQTCIDSRVNQLSQQVLQVKLQSSGDASNTVKGTRMKVVVENEDHSRSTYVVPAGQRFTLDGVLPSEDANVWSFEFFQRRAFDFAYYAAIAFVWAFGIVAAFYYFRKQDQMEIAYIASVIAVFVPGSGYVMIMVWAGVEAFLRYYTAA